MEKKQTAVEWLFEKITQNEEIRWRGTRYLELFEQAKQMEKEQIKDAFGEKRQFMGFEDNDEFWITDMTAEQYYNETYGKEDSN
jgi:hypothetical protein